MWVQRQGQAALVGCIPGGQKEMGEEEEMEMRGLVMVSPTCPYRPAPTN